MANKEWRITVGSDLDYEDLVADIFYDHEGVVMLSQEEGFENLLITIYPTKKGNEWNLNLNEFEEAMKYAKKRLWDLRRIDNSV